jgi:arylsulfatase A-like enzyme
LVHRRARTLFALFALCSSLAVSGAAAQAPAPDTPPPAQKRPNIVFVLTDDLSLNLLRFMPHVAKLQQDGVSFRNYFVSDSLCCPSRTSILTGKLPHNTGVFSNVGPGGGFRAFQNHKQEGSTFAVKLKRSGYRTGFMGKYLNGYMTAESGGAPDTYVPRGWSDWAGAGDGYSEFDYKLNENGRLHGYGHKPADYLTDVLADKGVQFIDSAAAGTQPFFLELAPFAPHSPYVPAPRDAHAFPGLTAPRPPNFDALPSRAPRWLADHKPLTEAKTDQVDTIFRKRAQSVRAVDEMVGRLQDAIASHHLSDNTYVVFSSDNGFHTGQFRLTAGKLTAYDPDIRVPLIVTGPNVPAGQTVTPMALNVDLAPTFANLGGAALPGDGHSLVPLLKGQMTTGWRDSILVEHHGPKWRLSDPDRQHDPSGNPTTYDALRTTKSLYVEYRDGEREYYDLARDPYELHNIVRRLPAAKRRHLHLALAKAKKCRGVDQRGVRRCWTAMHVGAP